jgi:hypothetical protein
MRRALRQSLAALGVCSLAACSHERLDLSSPPPASQASVPTVLQTSPDDPRDRHPGQVPMVPADDSPQVANGRELMPTPMPMIVPVPPRLLDVIVADAPPPPISGGTLTVADDGSVAVAADPDRDAIYVVRLANQNVQTIGLDKGSEPGRVVLDASGHAHVALRSSGKLARIDLASAQLERSTNVCALPRGVAYDAPNDLVWIACASGELVSVEAATHFERSRSFIAIDLRDVIIDASGARFVSRYRSAELLRIEADGSVASRAAPFATLGLQVGSSNIAGQSLSGQALFPTSPTLAWKILRGPDGAPWMLHQRSRDDAISVVSWNVDRASGVTRPHLTRYADEGFARDSLPLDAAVTLAVDAASSRDGHWLAVADPGAYLQARPSVWVMPISSLECGALQNPAGAAPTPQAADAGAAACGQASLLELGEDMQATSVAFDQAGLLYAFGREPAMLDVYDFTSDRAAADSGTWPPRTVSIRLSDRSVRDTGHELFHADVGSGIACASCHGEALDDGHVWDLSNGPRRTQNIRGGLLATLPLHWQGEFASFGALVDTILTQRMSGFQVEGKYSAALGNWIDKQPALRLASGDPASIARGKTSFESPDVGCNQCHSGDALTNNQTIDVGTGGAFQVPSLRGLALHPPFMHDGCAKTLEDRFRMPCGGDNRHADTSQLTAAQRQDLIAYLTSL